MCTHVELFLNINMMMMMKVYISGFRVGKILKNESEHWDGKNMASFGSFEDSHLRQADHSRIVYLKQSFPSAARKQATKIPFNSMN